MKNNNNLLYYKELKYKIEIDFILSENNQENYFLAYSNELGKGSCYGIGKSEEEAVSDYKKNKDAYLDYLFENDIEIPSAKPDELKFDYSGYFNVRTTPQLHSKVVKMAKDNKVSLNKYINILISQEIGAADIKTELLNAIWELKNQLSEHDYRVNSQIVEYNKNAIKGSYVSEEEEHDLLQYFGGEKFKPLKKAG